jgi:hypothetical protein
LTAINNLNASADRKSANRIGFEANERVPRSRSRCVVQAKNVCLRMALRRKKMTSLTRYLSIAAAMLGILAIAPAAALAQAGQEHEQHHPQSAPANGAQAEPAPADKGAGHSETPKGGMMGGGDMMGGPMMGKMMQGGAGMGMQNGCPMMGMMKGDAAGKAQDRVASLETELAITDAQKEIWSAYAAALKKDLESMHTAHETMMKSMAAQSPVERLDRHLATMEGRLASLKEVKPALSNLYAALDDNQKKAANELLTGMGCMM